MKRLSRRVDDSDQTLDISPLIDMVFILLIFFMVTTTFNKDYQIELERPGAGSAAVSDSKSVRVFIDRFGDIYVEDNPVRSWALQSKVREMIRGNNKTSILVVTDKNVSSEKLIDVVDQIRLGGANDVGVATKSELGLL